MNYDPNIVFCGRTATQTVMLTFGKWKYRTGMTVKIGGNCLGKPVIDAAVSSAYNRLERSERDEDMAVIEMVDPDGKTFIEEDDEMQGEDWLANMLIAAEITAIEALAK